MRKLPEMIFIIDTNIESLAVKEAVKLNIPIVAILDTNSDPTDIEFPIPGNDDAIRAIRVYTNAIADSVLDGRGIVTTGAAKQDEYVEVTEDAPAAS